MACLYLIPTPLGATPTEWVLPVEINRIVRGLDYFIVENAKSARAFLKQVGTDKPLQDLDLRELSEHTSANLLPDLLAPLVAGRDAGLLSEAGCPAVADPGADLVHLAHALGIRVKPLVGPSSILMAVMASGLSGQRFAFHGYLPAKTDARTHALKQLERRATADQAAQIFIETPYRNQAMLESILHACAPDTWLTLACDLSTDTEYIASRRVMVWRAHLPELNRRPCVFVIGRDPK